MTKAMSGQHSVEHLFGLLKGFSYPDGLVPVPQRIPGTAFFPGGYGLWRKTRGGLPPMPCGKVMVLGNNFDSECGYRKSLQKGDELHTPTWQNLLQLFGSVGIRPEDCFFTNAYMGLLASCPSNTGESPGARNSTFRKCCESFFAEQIAVQKPRLILALGRFVPEFIAPLSRDLAEWTEWRKWSGLDVSGPVKRVHFDFDDTGEQMTTVVALVHPSMRRSNLRWRRYRGRTGNEAELAMLKDALEMATRKGTPAAT